MGSAGASLRPDKPPRGASGQLPRQSTHAGRPGIGSRRVDQLVETLGLRISRSEVSRVCSLLDEQVEAFRSRPLEGEYPYLWLDAKVEKVREGGRVVNKAVVVAHGVHESGRREILGIDNRRR